jgi:hypothetical protein
MVEGGRKQQVGIGKLMGVLGQIIPRREIMVKPLRNASGDQGVSVTAR